MELIRKLTAGWRMLPPIHIVSTPQQMPIRVPSDCRGLFRGGEVFLVDGPAEQIARVLGHELAHHGVRVLHGPRWASFMAAVARGAREGDPVLVALRDRVRASHGDLPRFLESDEIAARLAEELLWSDHADVARAWAGHARWHAAARHLLREVLLLDRPADAKEVAGALLEAEHLLRNGRGADCLGWVYRPRMPTTRKPTGARRPPTSLRESEALLRADRERRRFWEEMQAMGMLLFAFVLAPIGWLACMGYVIWAAFHYLR